MLYNIEGPFIPLPRAKRQGENGFWSREPCASCGNKRPNFRMQLVCSVGSFLLSVELFYLQLTILAFFLQLTILAFSYSWSFLLTILAFFAYNWSFFAYSGKVRRIRALRDCKQRSSTVGKKAPNVSKKASPHS